MRIVIDMQPLQSPASKDRGVGRYTKTMVTLLCKQCKKNDEVFLALNGAYPESVLDISDYFSDFLPRDHIKVWHYYPEVPAAIDIALGNVAIDHASINNYTVPKAEELFREWFLAQFDADIVWTPNFQEGWNDKNIYTSARRTKGRAVICNTLHDVTPMVYPEKYLNQWIEGWYYSKITYSACSDYIFTVSDYSKKKIVELLKIPEEKVIRVYNTVEREKFFPDKDFADFESKNGEIFYYGGLDYHKNIQELLDAYERLPQDIRSGHKLHIVGRDTGVRGVRKEIEEAMGRNPNSIEWTEYLSDEDLVKALQRCSAFVYPSLAEGFGLPPLEAMSCGAPTLSSRATSLAEVIGSDAFSFDPQDISELTNKLNKLLTDENYFKECIRNGTRQVEKFSAEEIGKSLYCAFSQIAGKCHAEENYTSQQLINDLGVLSGSMNYNKVALWAKSIYESTLFRKSKTIFLDLSSTVPMDYITGIQRVAQNLSTVSKKLLRDRSDVSVEIVYRDPSCLTFYRAVFENNRWNMGSHGNKDIVIPRDGDIIVISDLNMGDIYGFRDYWHQLTREGIQVYAILYDLIPIYFSQYCHPNVVSGFQLYINSLHYLSGVICDSESVANDYKKYCIENNIHLREDFTVDYFHLGADLKKGAYSRGLPDGSDNVIAEFKARPTFIMVSTIEPRKRQDEILEAVEQMWRKGIDVNLCFVGRNGWLNDQLVKKLDTHKERGQRLFWLSGVSDEYLDLLYEESSAVVFASVSEGFGLSIVEGALHHKPLILRDIEVFREIAKDSAFYLHGKSAVEIASELEQWLALYEKGEAPGSEGVEVLTWEESTEMFLRKIGGIS